MGTTASFDSRRASSSAIRERTSASGGAPAGRPVRIVPARSRGRSLGVLRRIVLLRRLRPVSGRIRRTALSALGGSAGLLPGGRLFRTGGIRALRLRILRELVLFL